jgi:hypothetical protein
MNKYNIVLEKTTPSINNIENVTIEEFSNIISGTASYILCEILDNLTHEDRIKAIALMIKKISFGGEITLKFINLFKICKDLIKGNINSKSWSDIVEKSSSMFMESDILDIVSRIENIRVNKLYNSNNHIIIVLKKTDE